MGMEDVPHGNMLHGRGPDICTGYRFAAKGGMQSPLSLCGAGESRRGLSSICEDIRKRKQVFKVVSLRIASLSYNAIIRGRCSRESS